MGSVENRTGKPLLGVAKNGEMVSSCHRESGVLQLTGDLDSESNQGLGLGVGGWGGVTVWWLADQFESHFSSLSKGGVCGI